MANIDITVILDDEFLSWEAKGVAACIANRVPGFPVDHRLLRGVSKDGESDALYSALEELRENGYLVNKRHCDENGQTLRTSYTLTVEYV